MIHSSPVDSFVFGFQILPKHESPADAYKPLYTYKKSVGDIFFYDAVCKSHEQAMARIPSYYLEVRGYHDHFHSYTHKCRKYFNLERLQDRNVTFNTSGSEHINSQLKGIKVAAYNIHSDHFIFALL